MTPKIASEIAAVWAVKKGVIASAVRSNPKTAQGCRPISAVNQPVHVAIKGNGKLRNVAHKNRRYRPIRPAKFKYEPMKASASMIIPHPSMMRKVKNVMRTGGQSCRGKLVSPTSLESKLMLPIRLPRMGIEIAYLLLADAVS